MKIPLCKTTTDAREIAAIKRVIATGWLTDGPVTWEFEKRFAKYIGTKRAVALNSCTSALQLSIEAQDITGEVIVPSFTFVASVNAIINAGAEPVFADVDYDTCTIDPEEIKRKITSRTQAVMVVHYAGQSCDMERIKPLLKKYSLALIEDSAETIGGEFKGIKVGSFGIGCFSFFPTKNMTTGEGGMLTTNDDSLADKVRLLAGYGIARGALDREKDKRPWLREAIIAGYNYRMSGILAAIGIEQLKKLDSMNERRREHAAYLNKRLECKEIELPFEAPVRKHVYQMYTIKLKGIHRDAFVWALRRRNIMASVHFEPPVHLHKYYIGRTKNPVSLPVTEELSRSIVTLPMYPQMSKKELDYMVKSVHQALIQLKKIR